MIASCVIPSALPANLLCSVCTHAPGPGIAVYEVGFGTVQCTYTVLYNTLLYQIQCWITQESGVRLGTVYVIRVSAIPTFECGIF